jgi:hypothetical protein
VWELPPAPPPADRKALLDVTDFREVHGVDSAALREWVEKLPAGFRVADVNHCAGSAPPKFDGTAVADPRGARTQEKKLSFGLDAQGGPRHMADFTSMTQAGWDLRVTCPHDDGKLRPRHHIWTTGEGAGWSVWGLDLRQLNTRLAEWKKDGSRPVKFYLNDPDRGAGAADRPYGVFLESDLGLDWTAHTELTATDLAKTVEAARAAGRRVDSLSDLGTGANRTYCLVTVPNPTELAWTFRAGMTAAQYEAELASQKKVGRRPLSVRSEVVEGSVRYTAVWIEYSPAK